MATLEVKGDRNIIKGKLKQMKAKFTDDKEESPKKISHWPSNAMRFFPSF